MESIFITDLRPKAPLQEFAGNLERRHQTAAKINKVLARSHFVATVSFTSSCDSLNY